LEFGIVFFKRINLAKMSNNLLIERALHDVFNTTSYITFGTTDDPLPYPHKDVNLLWLSLSKAHEYNLL
jgi:hypothetical protein